MATKRDWLDDGALLILMPKSALPAWTGGDGSGYDRACDVANEWLVPFDVGGKRTFLLGGDPGMALFVPLPPSALGLIRWQYAIDEEELISFALRRESVRQTEPDLVFENTEPDWVLFNSAYNPATYKPDMRGAEMPTGTVVADTALVEAGHNSAILHRFRKAPGA